MSVIEKAQMAGYDQCLRARITDMNGDRWDYSLEYNPRSTSWKDKFDYLSNAEEDFESEWESNIESTELFEKVEDDDDLPIQY